MFVTDERISWRYRRGVVEAVVGVLAGNYEVVAPRFGCCWAPCRHSEQFEGAEALACRNLSVLEELGEVDSVVVPDPGGCQTGLLRYVRGRRVVEAVQLLADGLREKRGRDEVVQHTCHLVDVAELAMRSSRYPRCRA